MDGDYAVAVLGVHERVVEERVGIVVNTIPENAVASHDGGVADGILKDGDLTIGCVRAHASCADHRVGGGASRRDRDAATRTRCWRPLVVGGAIRLQGDAGPLTDGVRRNRDDNLRRGMDGHIHLGGIHVGTHSGDMQRILARLVGMYPRDCHIRHVGGRSPSSRTGPMIGGTRQRFHTGQHQRVPVA